ncbi:MAG: hypothetical protein HOQ24_04320 [Mycobacteriaceae bacterium]|nr:hypothetical protein [Mycobacteriaceae bacterium]
MKLLGMVVGMAKGSSSIEARRRARERLARERLEQIERNKANEADLTEYLLLEHRIGAAEVERDASFAQIEVNHRSAVEEMLGLQVECVRRMRARGEKVAAIADLTGLTVRDVNRISKASNGRNNPESDAGGGHAANWQ